MMSMRVREVLALPGMRRALRGKLPKECLEVPPELLAKGGGKYPGTLLKAFPKEDAHCMLGVLTEYLLRLQVEDIRGAAVKAWALEWFGISIPEKTLGLVTTQAYLERVRSTRVKLDQLLEEKGKKKRETFEYDTVVSGEGIEGHPDIQCGTLIFEVKTTGRVKQGWIDFLMQVFAYGALAEGCTVVHLVFPLDSSIWSYDITAWDRKKRAAYKKVLEDAGSERAREAAQDGQGERAGMALLGAYGIGTHVKKHKTLPATLQAVVQAGMADVPVQIFLGGPTTLRLKDVSDRDLAEACHIIEKHRLRLFVHAPYTINLADRSAAELYLPCLQKHLAIGTAIGAAGVVVHVGKHCHRYASCGEEIARNHMKMALHETLRAAAAGGGECPLLLETPAGQGTELLTRMTDFVDFALELSYELTDKEQSLFGICVDTCHVFATGVCPQTYLTHVLEKAKRMLKLVHFNDSLGDCGSCVDRHAFVCCGKINKDVLAGCAKLAHDNRIPMLTE